MNLLPGRSGGGNPKDPASFRSFGDTRAQILSTPTSPLLLAVFYVLVMVVVFIWVQQPFRIVETKLYVEILFILGVHGLPQVNGVNVLVVPANHGSFYVQLTPSCSALSPALALMVLSMTLPKRNWPGTTIPASRWRRPLAVVAAVAVVMFGNMLRIDSCIVVGLLAGSASLVLFHNWVGSIFTFAAVLGGYILMLWIVLPDELTLQTLRRRASETGRAVLHGDEVIPEPPRPTLPVSPPPEH